MTFPPIRPSLLGVAMLCLAAPALAGPQIGTYDCRSAQGQWFVYQFDDASCSINGQAGALVSSNDIECHLNPVDGRGFVIAPDLSFVAGSAEGLQPVGLDGGYTGGVLSSGSQCIKR